MKKYLFVLSSVLFLGLTSCKDTQKEPSNVTIDGNATETPAPAVDEHAGHNHDDHAGHNHGDAANSNANPEHGQPGHRCDIPVGAPLDTPPGGNGNPMSSAQPAPAQGGQPFLVNDQAKSRIMQEQGQPAATSAGSNSGNINPAHGQPGHRCDIPVGQPIPA